MSNIEKEDLTREAFTSHIIQDVSNIIPNIIKFNQGFKACEDENKKLKAVVGELVKDAKPGTLVKVGLGHLVKDTTRNTASKKIQKKKTPGNSKEGSKKK